MLLCFVKYKECWIFKAISCKLQLEIVTAQHLRHNHSDHQMFTNCRKLLIITLGLWLATLRFSATISCFETYQTLRSELIFSIVLLRIVIFCGFILLLLCIYFQYSTQEKVLFVKRWMKIVFSTTACWNSQKHIRLCKAFLVLCFCAAF